MAIAQVQRKSAASTSDSTSHSITFDSAPTQGNLLVVVYSSDGGGAAGPNGGWTPVTGTDGVLSADFTAVICWYKIAGASESSTISFTFASASNLAVTAYEYSGIAASSPVDKVAGNSPGSSTGTCATGTTATTTQADELLIAGVGQTTAGGGTLRTIASWNNSFTAELHIASTGSPVNTSISVASRIVSATGTYSSTATFSGGNSNHPSAGIVTFKAAAAPSGIRGRSPFKPTIFESRLIA